MGMGLFDALHVGIRTLGTIFPATDIDHFTNFVEPLKVALSISDDL